MLAFDIEANGLDQHAPDYRVFMITWADADTEWMVDESMGYAWAQPFLDAIAQEEVLVAANASYDIHGLHADSIVDLLSGAWRVHDVLTLARVCVPGRFQYKLKGLSTDILGAGAADEEAHLKALAKQHGISWTLKDKDYYGLWKVEPEAMAMYAKQDVRITYDLFQRIWDRASASDCQVYAMEIKGVAPILRAAEREGVLVDKTRLATLKSRLLDERDELRCQLLAQGLSEEALGTEATEDEAAGKASSKALLADLLRIGVPLYRKTAKSGEVNAKGTRNPDQFAVNKDALKEFEKRYPVVRDLLAWRSKNILLRTFVAALEKADPRVHTSFSQAEARTSRMSASRPNVQNLPTVEEERAGRKRQVGVRDVLIPGEGQAFICADFDSVEVRVLAHYIGHPELTTALDDGLDMHSLTASRVHGGRYEDYLKGGPNDKKRTLAKVTTFTALYGGGARLLSTRLGITTAEAAKIKQDTLDSIPGYWEFDERVKSAVRGRHFPHVTTILGRRLFVPKEKPYVAGNTIIQGTSAELMKLGMIAATPVIAEYGYRPTLVVHDELVGVGPASQAEPALVALIAAMESVYPLRPRLRATGNWSLDSYGACK